jgi:hypothetical protein
MMLSSILGLLLCVEAFGQIAPDANLYYQRTHNGQLPPVEGNPSDHSWETAASQPASSEPSKPVSTGGTGALDLRANGVDPANLGKGDWIWQIPETEAHLGVTNVQGIIDYEKNLGMRWITVKCGDGGYIWTQFNSDLISRAHAAGLRIFGWAYAYGSNVQGEINVALNALNLGADGFIIDAETEYEIRTNNSAAAAQYCQGIRALYPNLFLAFAPFPYISLHPGFPYVAFGKYCDTVMPQDYWDAIGVTPWQMVQDMNSQWRSWQSSLTGSDTNAIKPIAPVAQSFAPATGAEISAFVEALRTNMPQALPGGYNGLSFWDAADRSAEMDNAIRIAGAGITNNPPFIGLQPTSRAMDSGATLKLSVLASGAAPLRYQWRFNGANLGGATSSRFTLQNVQVFHSGNYDVIVSNSYGAATSRVSSVTVYPPQQVLFSDDFDVNSTANWLVSRSSADTQVTFAYDYSALGIPPAPHSSGGTTRGVQFMANMSNGAPAALSISPAGRSFSGDYRLHFDMWINANGPFPGGGVGSTEYLTAGIGSAGNRTEWIAPFSIADGYWFSVDGEGGVSDISASQGDFVAYTGTNAQAAGSGRYWAGTDASSRGNGNSYYLADFPGGQTPPSQQQVLDPQQTGALDLGTVGFVWNDVIVSVQGDVVEWSINGLKVATFTNTPSTAGNITLGLWDPFASVSDNPAVSFGLVDNVRVEAPTTPPVITKQPQSISVAQGGAASFRVVVSGAGPISYQWLYNGGFINGATNSVYTRTSTQTTNAGRYSVFISSLNGTATSTDAFLTVNIPPFISTQPADLTVNQGTDAVFTVGASGTTPLSYQWEFNGAPIAAATKPSLVVPSAQATNAGLYSVLITNVAGSVLSSNAHLIVNLAPTILAQPQSLVVNQGDTAMLTVVATGTPPVYYQWVFNGGTLAGATQSALIYSNAQPNVSGVYSVIVSNLVSTVTSSNATLRVNLRPIANASATRGLLISANGTNATAVLDGSRSYDRDGDLLQYTWFVPPAARPIATDAVAVVTLPVATNRIQLVVSDGFASSTDTVTVAVLTTAQGVLMMEAMVQASDLRHAQPFVASLDAAYASIVRGNTTPAMNQLKAFENKVRVQAADLSPALATVLIQVTGQILDALAAGPGGRMRPRAARIEPRDHFPGHLAFFASPRGVYIIEASPDLVTWRPIGVAVEMDEGRFEFDDRETSRFPARFYRITKP